LLKKSLAVGIILLFTSSGIIPVVISDNPISTKTIYVDDDGGADFTHIQNAIDAASPGDTIFVYAGTYVENLVVDKSLTLTGEDKEITIIDGGGFKDVIRAIEDDTKISQFTIQNSGQFPDTSGLDITTNNNIISNNNIYQNNYDAITCSFSNNNIISNNNIFNNKFGIRLISSDNNQIIENKISNQSDYNSGIILSDSNNNLIENNEITNNTEDGVRLLESCNNTIKDNLISYNYAYGIMVASFSNNNLIRYNKIIKNGGFLNIDVGLIFIGRVIEISFLTMKL